MLALLLLAALARPALAGPCAGSQPQICPLGEPSGQSDCRIGADCTVPSRSVFEPWDFGARRLVVAASREVSVTGVPGQIAIAAGSVLLEPSARIRAAGNGIGAQLVQITAADGITLQSGALIDVGSGAGTLQSPGAGGTIRLRGAAVQLSGELRADGRGRDTFGGQVFVEATGGSALSLGSIDVRGGDRAGGGSLVVRAGGTINAGGAIKCQGLEGGTVELEAGGDIVTSSAATIGVEATGEEGSGGFVDARAGGSVTIGGAVKASGAPLDGDGADFTATAFAGSITISANLDLSGAPDGFGGDLELTAGRDILITGKVLMGAAGVYGAGSLVLITAGRDLTLRGTLDASSAGAGGDMVLVAGGTALVGSTGRIDVRGPTDPKVGAGGRLSITACSVEIANAAVLSALGAGVFPYAGNDLQASSSIRIGGELRAGSANRLVYRTTPGSIQILTTAKLTPAGPVVPCPSAGQARGTCSLQDPDLLCCGDGCTTTTTTTLPVPTSTTTTSPATSTTASTPGTTSTTASTAPPTTATTSSSSTSTAPTSSSSTTFGSTTTTAPDGTSTTTLATTSTTTTVGEPPATTSTTVPPPGSECAARPSAVDAAACRVGTVAQTLETTPLDSLGGKATARRLNALVRRADRFLGQASRGAKVKANLRRARLELKAFEKAVRRGLARKRKPIDRELGELVLGLTTAASNDVQASQAADR